MPEWSTYELSNFLLFSPRTYDRMLESYNAGIWPGHVVAVLSGIAIVFLATRRGDRESIVSAGLLALAWLWVAWAFHFLRYSPINWAARWFAAAFALQAVMILATEWGSHVLARSRGASRASTDSETPTRPLGRTAIAGILLASFAVVALPLVERLLGRPWSQVEVFALFPDATALATLGVLLAGDRVDWHLSVIPLIWCVIGAGTLAAMGKPDAGIIIATALLAGGLLVWKGRESSRAAGA